MCVSERDLRDLAVRLQVSAGISEKDAGTVADCLVEADLMGVSTHGVTRLKFYLDRVNAGGNNPTPEMHVVRDNACTAVIDADNALGPVAGTFAMRTAIKKAQETGVAVVLARNCNHYGPAGYYARMAVAEDMLGVSMCNVLGSMPPTGGAEALLGNNPFSLAVPAGAEAPIVVDACTSKSSWGKLFLCAKTGEQLPPECFTDRNGRVTVDPQAVLDGGALLPIAAHKGYGIAAAITLLTGMLADGVLDHNIPHPYKHPSDGGSNTCLMAAMRVSDFCEIVDFKARMDTWIGMIRGSRKANGVARIWLPGEIEAEARKERQARGIPLPEAVIAELRDMADAAGTPFPAASR